MTHAERMKMVSDDCGADAAALDRTPFTPRGMGEALGQILAQVAAVADTLRVLCEKEGL